MRHRLITACATIAIMATVLAIVARNPERTADDVPASLANCVAEQAYVNPMDDRMKELENALAICTQGRNDE